MNGYSNVFYLSNISDTEENKLWHLKQVDERIN